MKISPFGRNDNTNRAILESPLQRKTVNQSQLQTLMLLLSPKNQQCKPMLIFFVIRAVIPTIGGTFFKATSFYAGKRSICFLMKISPFGRNDNTDRAILESPLQRKTVNRSQTKTLMLLLSPKNQHHKPVLIFFALCHSDDRRNRLQSNIILCR